MSQRKNETREEYLERRRLYARAWRRDHPDLVKGYAEKYRERGREVQREYRQRNLVSISEKTRLRARKRRQEALDAYGAICRCCGEARFEFLAFDHRDGGGADHRRQVGFGSTFLKWLRDSNFPPSIQVLCHNCNLAKAFYGSCPHALSE